MKCMAFFNEKGGVGKTTMSTLFSSYLSYHCGEKVIAVDTECPSFRMLSNRESDLKQMAVPDSPLRKFVLADSSRRHEPYPIMTVGCEVNTYTKSDMQQLIDTMVTLKEESEYDYCIIDFPAGFSAKSPVSVLASCGVIDLVAVPVDTDAQTRTAGLRVADAMHRAGIETVIFWNRVTAAELREGGRLSSGEKIFNDYGLSFLPQRVKAFEKARRESDSSGRIFVRNTICWPQRYVEMNCPVLPQLFAEIKQRLDSIPD